MKLVKPQITTRNALVTKTELHPGEQWTVEHYITEIWWTSAFTVSHVHCVKACAGSRTGECDSWIFFWAIRRNDPGLTNWCKHVSQGKIHKCKQVHLTSVIHLQIPYVIVGFPWDNITKAQVLLYPVFSCFDFSLCLTLKNQYKSVSAIFHEEAEYHNTFLGLSGVSSTVCGRGRCCLVHLGIKRNIKPPREPWQKGHAHWAIHRQHRPKVTCGCQFCLASRSTLFVHHPVMPIGWYVIFFPMIYWPETLAHPKSTIYAICTSTLNFWA